ncbi:hypothetical protein [Cellulomonas sp. P5_C6]
MQPDADKGAVGPSDDPRPREPDDVPTAPDDPTDAPPTDGPLNSA